VDSVTDVARGVISNGVDSHVKAGTDKPLTVRVPTTMNLTFSVRDYGVGMDHATVMTNYSTLFDSTKEEDDSQIGKLGLGSKSPFAYTDAFNLQCWDGTSVRRYMVYINDQHVPVIDYVGSEASDEPRGVEVGLAVEPAQFADFKYAATRIASDLYVIPTFIGTDAPTAPEVIDRGEGWTFYRANGYSLNLAARQGQITYAIDQNQLSGLMTLLPIATGRGHGRLVFDFPPNTLGFTASREQLEYTPETVAKIRAAVETFIDGQFEKYRKMLRTNKSAWKLRRYISKHGLQDVFTHLLRFETHFGKSSIPFHWYMPKKLGGNATVFLMTSRRSVVQYPTWRKNAMTANAISSDSVLFWYDTRKPVKDLYARVSEKMYWEYRYKSRDKAVLIRYSSDMELKRIQVALGRPDEGIDVADLPEVQKGTNSVKREYTNAGVLTSDGVEKRKIDLKQGGIYLVAERENVYINGFKSYHSFRAIADMWKIAREFGGLSGDVHVFTPSQATKMETRPGWTRLETVIDALHVRYADRVAIAQAFANRHPYLSGVVADLMTHVEGLLEKDGTVDPRFGTALVKATEARREFYTLKRTYERYLDLAPAFRAIGKEVHADTSIRVPAVGKLGAAVLQEFPLLNHIGNAPIDMIVNDYILR